jgi:hypothetical protein
MATYASGFNFTNTLQSLTKDRVISDYIVETFFNSAKVWQYINGKGMVELDGNGLALTWGVNVSGSPNTVAFSGDDNLPITSMDTNIIRAALDPKFYADALVIKLTDSALNNGAPDAVANYVEAQLDVVKMSIVNQIADDLIKNTNTLNSKKLNGLNESVDDGTGGGSSYAGISRTTFPTWKANINWASADATRVADLNTVYINAQLDNDRPDFFAVNKKAFIGFQSKLLASDRYIQPDLARTFGGLDLLYQGNPMFLDSHIATGAAAPSGGGAGGIAYALNSNYLKLIVLDGWNFQLTEWQMAQSNATVFTRVFWGGNLVNTKPPAHAAVWVSGD